MRRARLRFNEKKTNIVPVRNGFTFLKIQYRVLPTGKVLKRLMIAGTVRMHRKLKKFRHLVDKGEMTMDDVYNSIQS